MATSEDIIQHMTKRIDILVNEINSLTDIIHGNINDQSELMNKQTRFRQKYLLRYNELLKDFQQQQLTLAQTEAKLSQALKHNLHTNIEKLQEDRQHIDKLLSESHNELANGQHPLQALCQEKIHVEQQLRARLNELEKQNAVLHSENARMRSFIQHDRMFQQMEQISGKLQIQNTFQPTTHIPVQSYQQFPYQQQQPQQYQVQQRIQQPIVQQISPQDLKNYPQHHLNMYLQGRENMQPRENPQIQTRAIHPETELFPKEKNQNTPSPVRNNQNDGRKILTRSSLSKEKSKK